MAERTHRNPFSAVLSAVMDLRNKKGTVEPLADSVSLVGRTCLVTGSNTGLGKAIAIDFARRGAHVLMACRSGIPEAGEDVKRITGNLNVEMLPVDLSDFDSIRQFCDTLRNRRVKLDIAVLNAGLMPKETRLNHHGLEMMFAVNFLEKPAVLTRLLRDGIIPNRVFGGNSRAEDPPRIIFVSSETHRTAPSIDFEQFGVPMQYGVTNGVKYYGLSKLHLTTYAQELSRRLNPGGDLDVCVHALCPGGINSDMAREAPWYIKPALRPVMAMLFQSPEKAAVPVSYLAASDAMGKNTGAYMHMMRIKPPSDEASDPEKGAQLWEKTQALLQKHGAV